MDSKEKSSIGVIQQNGAAIVVVFNPDQTGKINVVSKDRQVFKVNSERIFVIQENVTEKELPELEQAAAELAKDINLEAVWQKFQNESKLSVEDTCNFIFQKSSPEAKLALYQKLIEEFIYFKRKNNDFYPVSSAESETRKENFLLQGKKNQNLELTLQYIKEKRTFSEGIPDFAKELIENLKLFAAESKSFDSDNRKNILAFMQKLKNILGIEDTGNTEKNAFHIIQKLGLLKETPHLIFIKHALTDDCPKEVLQEIKKLKERYSQIIADKSKRKDCTSLETFTIDAEDTKDMDDAISIKRIESGFEVGVHISDVASLVPPKSALDRFAAKRVTSIYCPDQKFNMFPDEIAENLASLIAGEVRPTVSLIIQVDSSFKIISSKIHQSLIKVSKRLSYKEADQLIEAEQPDMLELYQISSEHQTMRELKGAMQSPKKVADISVINGSPKLEIIDEDSFSRSMIAELMVMTNHFFAEYAAKNFLTCFFRGQNKVTNVDDSRDFQSSYVSLTARSHASLGLSSYLQVTSPIRRYQDLCNQRQIVSHINSKQALYHRSDLEKMSSHHANQLREAAQCTKECRRFWLLKYLQINHSNGDILNAIVLKNDKKRALIQITDYLINSVVALPKETEVGSQIKVRLLDVNPEINELRFEHTR